jgi:hypothetical protein
MKNIKLQRTATDRGKAARHNQVTVESDIFDKSSSSDINILATESVQGIKPKKTFVG